MQFTERPLHGISTKSVEALLATMKSFSEYRLTGIYSKPVPLTNVNARTNKCSSHI